ncbi:two-component system, CitB family, sensor histidine kinase MalK [Evansella caseinilytica]|uniref:histidine kinase n=1 Tax=Evansella caseinilytica TaxID=1503961 RepID=A0A1H3TMG9_9BACI|nr:DcuS/MalK family sensor histidine kinase [Evansella caseinilytica]SDZ51444.1 two-component system, CitB family, sensor histidine kinase MalK [Evansella caseinilytica]
MLRRRYKLRTIIIFLVIVVVSMSLLFTDLLVTRSVGENIMIDQEEKALMAARIVANSEIVQRGLTEKKSEEVQRYANEILAATDVLFVVVMDMNAIRYSHPNPEKVGKSFEGGDEVDALKGQEYSSIGTGTLTTSLRSFTPVVNENNEQIGVVAVGISLEHVEQTLNRSHRNVIIGSLFGILIGVIGAVLIAHYIKKILYGLEPFTIAKTFEERNTMLQSVHEGIIAVDKDAKITLVNKTGLRLFAKAGLKEDPIGMEITEYMPPTRLDRVLKTGKPERNEEMEFNGISFLVNRVPLVVDKQIIGAISTFRDKTEVNELAKQLTGVKGYAEALRAQSHEVMNKLHVILGMVRNEAYDELNSYILQLVNHKNNEIGLVSKNMKDPVLAGFIIGKLSHARENGIKLKFINETELPAPASADTSHDIITILGNLIDNAVEALADSEVKKIEVKLSYSENQLTMRVEDTGRGIKRGQLADIFEKGFSTKGEHRGYGLYLVRKSIDKLGGSLLIDSFYGEGTVFNVEIPYEAEVDAVD